MEKYQIEVGEDGQVGYLDNGQDVSINGTSFMGSIVSTYDELFETFGQETLDGSADGKVQAEWVIMTPDGVATIYDYKSAVKKEAVTDWHIGGRDVGVVGWVLKALEVNRK